MNTNIFGTDGIRARVGSSPFTQTHVPRLGHALAQWIQNKYGNNATLLLAHDTRQSCSWIKASIKESLLRYPITVHDAQIVSTPAVCKLISKSTTFNCGIMISASHNPYYDNGIKIIDAQNGKLTTQDELIISQLFHENRPPKMYAQLGTILELSTAKDHYIESLTDYFTPGFLQGTHVVLDCAHGATSSIAAPIFSRLGAHVIEINNTPNGTNINEHCGPLHPQDLQKAVSNHQAHAGFAFDGDGDRVIAVNHYGQIKDGDDLLALLNNHPRYAQQPAIVGTIMSNQGLAVFLENNHKQLLRTSVGDKYVTEQLVQENLLLGGEQSGHIIMRDYLNSGDGIFTALRILETIIHTNNWDMTTFEKYPQILINIPITQKKDLHKPPFSSIIAEHESKLHSGRVLVRYSGTEPILRVMVEDCNKATVEQVSTGLAHDLEQALR